MHQSTKSDRWIQDREKTCNARQAGKEMLFLAKITLNECGHLLPTPQARFYYVQFDLMTPQN